MVLVLAERVCQISIVGRIWEKYTQYSEMHEKSLQKNTLLAVNVSQEIQTLSFTLQRAKEHDPTVILHPEFLLNK